MTKNKLSNKKTRGKKSITKKTKQESRSYEIRQNLFAYIINDLIYLALYIKVKNLSYILVCSKWDGSGNSKSNIIISSNYNSNKIV